MVDPHAQLIAATTAGAVVRLDWRQAGRPEVSELFQVLRFRDGKIFEMEDHRDRGKALKALGASS